MTPAAAYAMQNRIATEAKAAAEQALATLRHGGPKFPDDGGPAFAGVNQDGSLWITFNGDLSAEVAKRFALWMSNTFLDEA